MEGSGAFFATVNACFRGGWGSADIVPHAGSQTINTLPSPQKHEQHSSAAKAQQPAARGASVATRAAPVEVAQLASEAGFIGGVALTMTAITLLVSFHR
jgi:hypothetical protein